MFIDEVSKDVQGEGGLKSGHREEFKACSNFKFAERIDLFDFFFFMSERGSYFGGIDARE